MELLRIRRLTVGQLRSAPDVDVVMLVGRLTFVPGSRVSWLFDLDDSTGVVRGSRNCVTTRVVDDVEERIRQESNKMLDLDLQIGPPPWKDGQYHCVAGMVSADGTLEATHIRPLHDMNELTMHLLECIHQHCVLNKLNNK
jgi:hypothetical protein